MSDEEENDGQTPQSTPKTGDPNAGKNIELFSTLKFL